MKRTNANLFVTLTSAASLVPGMCECSLCSASLNGGGRGGPVERPRLLQKARARVHSPRVTQAVGRTQVQTWVIWFCRSTSQTQLPVFKANPVSILHQSRREPASPWVQGSRCQSEAAKVAAAFQFQVAICKFHHAKLLNKHRIGKYYTSKLSAELSSILFLSQFKALNISGIKWNELNITLVQQQTTWAKKGFSACKAGSASLLDSVSTKRDPQHPQTHSAVC